MFFDNLEIFASLKIYITIFKNNFDFKFTFIIACVIVVLMFLEPIYLFLAKRYFKKYGRYKGSPDDKFFIYDKRNNTKPFETKKAYLCLKICRQAYFDYPQANVLKELLMNFPANTNDLKEYDLNFISNIQNFINKYNLEYLHSKSFNNGFFALAFRDKKTEDIIISYRGSNDQNDWLFNNYTILSHMIPDQIFAAIDFYKECRIKFNPENKNHIIITGHSLGGGLAQLVGTFEPDTSVYTYNAIGVYHLLDEPDFYQYLGIASQESPVFKKYLEVVNEVDGNLIKNLSSIIKTPHSKLCADNIYNLVCGSDIVGNIAEHIGETDFILHFKKAGTLEIFTIRYLRILFGVRLSILSFFRRNFVYPVVIDLLENNSCLFRKKLAEKQSFYNFFFNKNADSKIKDLTGKFSYILFVLKYPLLIVLFTIFIMLGVINIFPLVKSAGLFDKNAIEFICCYIAAFSSLVIAGFIIILCLFKPVLKKLLVSHGLDLIENQLVYLINRSDPSNLFTSETRRNEFLFPYIYRTYFELFKIFLKNIEKIAVFSGKCLLGIILTGIALFVAIYSINYITQTENLFLSMLIMPTIFTLLTFLALNIFSEIFKK